MKSMTFVFQRSFLLVALPKIGESKMLSRSRSSFGLCLPSTRGGSCRFEAPGAVEFSAAVLHWFSGGFDWFRGGFCGYNLVIQYMYFDFHSMSFDKWSIRPYYLRHDLF